MSALPSSFVIPIQLQDSSFAGLFAVVVNSDGKVTCEDMVGGIFQTTVAAMVPNTTYRIWFHFKKGTGSNAIGEVWFDASDTRPASGSNNWAGGTNGQATGDVDHCTFQNTGGGDTSKDITFDNVQSSTTDEFSPSPVRRVGSMFAMFQ
jgi:hypothetical protein